MGRYGDRGGGEKQEGKERLEKTDQVGAGRGRGRQGKQRGALGGRLEIQGKAGVYMEAGCR